MNPTPILHKCLVKLFDLDDYRMLCLALDAPYDNIVTRGGTLTEAAGRLMAFCKQRGISRQLMDLVAAERKGDPLVEELEATRLERPAAGMIVVATPDLPANLIKNVLGAFRAELVDPPAGSHHDLGRYLGRIRDLASRASACVAVLGRTGVPAHPHTAMTHLEAVYLAAFFRELPCWVATEKASQPTGPQAAMLSLIAEVDESRTFRYERDEDGMDLVRALQECLSEVQEKLFN